MIIASITKYPPQETKAAALQIYSSAPAITNVWKLLEGRNWQKPRCDTSTAATALSPPAPHPTLTLHQSYCKLNIKPIIPCIWVIVLARRVASTATSLAHTLQLMPCLMLGGCWCRGGGQRPLKIYSAPPKTLVSEEQLKNTPTDFAVVVSSATLLMLCNAYINTFHSGCCKASVYGKRWYPGTKAEPPHWKKKCLSGKLLAAQMQLTDLGGVAWQKDDLVRESGGLRPCRNLGKSEFCWLSSRLFAICEIDATGCRVPEL